MQVQNFGAGGTTLLTTRGTPYQKTKAYTQALKFKPNISVVVLGANDAGAGFDAATKAQFQQDYKALIAAFKTGNPTVKIYTCLPPPRYSARIAVLSNDILPLIRTVARGEGLQVIDFYTPLSNHFELFSDGTHPNVQGARLIAATAYSALIGQQPPA